MELKKFIWRRPPQARGEASAGSFSREHPTRSRKGTREIGSLRSQFSGEREAPDLFLQAHNGVPAGKVGYSLIHSVASNAMIALAPLMAGSSTSSICPVARCCFSL